METTLSIVSLIISVITGGFALYTFFWTAARDRKQATLDAYNALQEQALDHLNHYMPKMIEEIAAHPRSDEYKTVSAYVARIEHFCVGVNRGIYDRQVVYDLAHGYLDGTIRSRITPLIARKNHHGGDYYSNIRRLYDWMEKQAGREAERCKKQTAPDV